MKYYNWNWRQQLIVYFQLLGWRRNPQTKLLAFTNRDLSLMVVTFLLGCPAHTSFSRLSREVCLGENCAGEGWLWKYHLVNLSFGSAPLWIHCLTWAGETTGFAQESAILSSSPGCSPIEHSSRWQRRDPNSVPVIQLCSDAVWDPKECCIQTSPSP